MTPFVLRDCKRLPAEPEPCSDHVFDRSLQVWISKQSGLPIILGMQREQSEFGETLITATVEGADQSEISTLVASQFGETTITRSEGEGTDQPAFATLSSSQFGESTTMNRSVPEGIDQPAFATISSSQFGESTKVTRTPEPLGDPNFFDGFSSQFGETTLTKTQEGTDQPEMSLPLSEPTISSEAF
jgi:hypothetical protein